MTELDELVDSLRIDFETGKCFWAKKITKKTVVGEEAGSVRPDGYCRIRFKGKYYYRHRVIFYERNRFLPDVVDHIKEVDNGDGVGNIQAATHQQNMMKQNINSLNKSGCPGVSWDTQRNKWLSTIKKDGKNIYIGRFASYDDAVTARINKEKELFGNFYNEHKRKACNSD